MKRQAMLAAKALEIEGLVQTWARDAGLIRPGQRITCLLEIADAITVGSDFAYLGRNVRPKGQRLHYIKAATLSPTEVEKVVEASPPKYQATLRALLTTHGNKATAFQDLPREHVNARLRGLEIEGKRYHLAVEFVDTEAARSNKLNAFYQLWEVEAKVSRQD